MASYRCEPLRDGRRDPLDPPRSRYAPAESVLIEAVVLGSGEIELLPLSNSGHSAIARAIRKLRIDRYDRPRHGRGWIIRQSIAAEDLLDLLERWGYRLRGRI